MERDKTRMMSELRRRIESSAERSSAAAHFLEESRFPTIFKKFALLLDGEVTHENILGTAFSLQRMDMDSSFLNLVWDEREVEDGLLGAYVIGVEAFPSGAILVRGSAMGAGSTVLTQHEWTSNEIKEEAVYKAIYAPEIVNLARSGEIEDEDEEQEIEIFREVLKYIH